MLLSQSFLTISQPIVRFILGIADTFPAATARASLSLLAFLILLELFSRGTIGTPARDFSRCQVLRRHSSVTTFSFAVYR